MATDLTRSKISKGKGGIQALIARPLHDSPCVDFDDQPGPYRYQPLQEGSIRLLRFCPRSTSNDIHCALDHRDNYNLQKTKYTALSYCWDDPALTNQITINGHTVLVANNLFAALTTIATYHDDARFYWIDALCINQEDDDEKAIQVGQMWQIYACAEQVYGWLGPTNDGTANAFDGMRAAAQACKIHPYNTYSKDKIKHRAGWECATPSGRHDDIIETLSVEVQQEIWDLTSRRYFTRTWIFQEVLRATQLIFLCGKYSLDWTLLEHICTTDLQAAVPCRRLLQRRRAVQHRDRRLHRFVKAEQFVYSLGAYAAGGCRDRRDRIYAMIGDPFVDSTGIKPSYKLSTDELAVMITAYFSGMTVQRIGTSHFKHVDKLSQSFCMNLHRALGSPDSLSAYRAWIRRHSEAVPGDDTVLVLQPSGIRIDCSGILMQELLNIKGTWKDCVTFSGSWWHSAKGRYPQVEDGDVA